MNDNSTKIYKMVSQLTQKIQIINDKINSLVIESDTNGQKLKDNSEFISATTLIKSEESVRILNKKMKETSASINSLTRNIIYESSDYTIDNAVIEEIIQADNIVKGI